MKSFTKDELEYSQRINYLKKTNAYRLPNIPEYKEEKNDYYAYIEEYTIKDKNYPDINYHVQPLCLSYDISDNGNKKRGFFEKAYWYIRNKFFRKKYNKY